MDVRLLCYCLVSSTSCWLSWNRGSWRNNLLLETRDHPSIHDSGTSYILLGESQVAKAFRFSVSLKWGPPTCEGHLLVGSTSDAAAH